MSATIDLSLGSGAETDIVVQSVCSEVRVFEDAFGSTAKVKFRGTNSGATLATMDAGFPLVFRALTKPFEKGQNLGKVTVDIAGPVTFKQVEF